jgi:hypothetical protein
VGENISAHRILVGKPEGQRLLRGRVVRWKDKIGMDFEKRREAVDRIDVAQDKTCPAFVDTVMRLYIP